VLNNVHSWDVVAGAGPVGLLVAGELAQTGVRVLVREPAVRAGPAPARASPQVRAGRHVLVEPDMERPEPGTFPTMLVRPDGYVAWATDDPRFDLGELGSLLGPVIARSDGGVGLPV